MIMKQKSKKFCFAKLFVFGIVMLVLQLATFIGDLPAPMAELEELGKTEIAEAAYSEYALLYTYDASDAPLATTFTYHESLIIGLACIAAVIAANFRSKTVSKTVATGCWSFAVLNILAHLALAIVDSTSWYTPYSLMECTPFTFGIMTTAVAAVIGVAAFFADPVIDTVTKKIEEKRWADYNAAREADLAEEG